MMEKNEVATRLISHDDIRRLNISPLQCYKWVSDMLEAKSGAELPPKISLKPKHDGTFFNTMPTVLPDLNVFGVKVITRFPSRVPSMDSHVFLYDLTSGDLKAIMDANWLTAMRTGAVAAHSIKLFAKEDFNVIGIVGLGNTARAAVSVLLSIFPDKPFRFKLMRYKDQHEDFRDRFASNTVSFEFCDTYKQLVSGSDVVIGAATVMTDDSIASDNCYGEGCLVVPIHSHGFMNCDLFFDRVLGDDTGHLKHFKYFAQWKNFAEVSDVISGKVGGRKSEKERILVYNIGLAIHDIFFAEKIFNIIKKDFQAFDFKRPVEKFWV